MATSSPVPIIGVGSIVLRHGRLLVIRRGREPHAGRWSLPGGRLEFGEQLADGALRELQEETGLVGSIAGLCGIAERISGTAHLVIHDFWVDVPDAQVAVAGDDAEAVGWVDRAELAALSCVPRLGEFLAEHGGLHRMR